MNQRHLFFDLDRTLWDFEKNSEIALHHLFQELNLIDHIPRFTVFHSLYKKKNAELWKLYGAGKIKKEELRTLRFSATLEVFGLRDQQIIDHLSDGYVELSPKQTALFPEALETLKLLQEQGYPMHIITNGFKEVQYIKLENSGLAPFFDIVVCSEDVGKNKPAPDIFHHALERAGAKATNSIMIGDDYAVDIIGAYNAGMQGILFDPEDKCIIRSGDHKIQHLNEIPGKLAWID